MSLSAAWAGVTLAPSEILLLTMFAAQLQISCTDIYQANIVFYLFIYFYSEEFLKFFMLNIFKSS